MQQNENTHTIKKNQKESAFKTYKNNFPLLLFHLIRITLLFLLFLFIFGALLILIASVCKIHNNKNFLLLSSQLPK